MLPKKGPVPVMFHGMLPPHGNSTVLAYGAATDDHGSVRVDIVETCGRTLVLLGANLRGRMVGEGRLLGLCPVGNPRARRDMAVEGSRGEGRGGAGREGRAGQGRGGKGKEGQGRGGEGRHLQVQAKCGPATLKVLEGASTLGDTVPSPVQERLDSQDVHLHTETFRA